MQNYTSRDSIRKHDIFKHITSKKLLASLLYFFLLHFIYAYVMPFLKHKADTINTIVCPKGCIILS